MSCELCGGFLDARGKCYDLRCDNRRAFKLPAKSKIKQQSKKQSKLYADTKGIRWEPIKAGQVCDLCQSKPSTEPHEIPAGTSRRHLAMRDIRAIAFVCHDCHDKMQGRPYAEQVAVVTKSVIAAVNRCCGSQAVDVNDVIQFLKKDYHE